MKRKLAIAVVLACCLPAAGAAGAAVLKYGPLVLRADGGFEPRHLPKRAFVPIRFQGHAGITTRDGSAPPALQQAILEFDRDGRLSTGGLPSCPLERVENATPREARRACRDAIVGTGHVTATITLPGVVLEASSPLTLFNGERQHGDPTVILHAQTTVPGTQTFAIVAPIERRRGPFRYRVTIDVPPIAAGFGALTHIDAKVGRRYRFKGRRRSYISARCSTGVLETHGSFTFSDGTVLEGAVQKPCSAR